MEPLGYSIMTLYSRDHPIRDSAFLRLGFRSAQPMGKVPERSPSVNLGRRLVLQKSGSFLSEVDLNFLERFE